MKVVLQRVNSASVEVDGSIVGKIGRGYVILLGISRDDNNSSVDYLVKKILNLKLFSNIGEKMVSSLTDITGEVLVVSQFTLYGNCKRGTKPSFSDAARPGKAKLLYEYFITQMSRSVKTESGIFGTHMKVTLVNDGPVTIVLEK